MQSSRAAWMQQGKFGLMVHWCVPKTPPQYGKLLDGWWFDVGIFQEGGLGPDTVSQLAKLATIVR